MVLLYRLGIGFYSILAKILALLGHKKARSLVKGRKETWQSLYQFSKQEGESVWFHCASLGEFEQGRPVIEAFRQQYPQYRVLLTFFSPSGYEVRKNYQQADLVCYLPADSAGNARRFIDLANPKLVFFVKYEFWHYYLSELKKRGIRTVLFASIFREKQIFFKPWGGFYRAILHNFEHIFVQTRNSKERLSSIGLTRVSVSNDTRFDRVHALCQNPKDVSIVEQFSQGVFTGVIGSAWMADVRVIAPVLKSYGGQLRLVVAPHEIGESNLRAMEKELMPLETVRFSSLVEENGIKGTTAQVLLIDNIGMLSFLYQYGDWAYIGGAFGKGLHNTLEAATFGLPIIFGSKYKKFQEAIGLIEQGAAHSIQNPEEFEQVFLQWFTNRDKAVKVGEKSAAYVRDNLGGTQQLIAYIEAQKWV